MEGEGGAAARTVFAFSCRYTSASVDWVLCTDVAV